MKELELCKKIVEGDVSAVEGFVARYRKPVEDYLISKCGDSSARDAARNISQDVFADCASGGLLEKFRGEGSLEGWLRQVAFNRLRKHWRKEGRRPDRISSDELELGEKVAGASVEAGGGVGDGAGGGSAGAGAFYEKLMAATMHAFGRLRDEYPDQLAILRLSELHGVRQRKLAAVFGIHESEISKKKKSGVEFLRSEVSSYLFREFPRGSFTWADLREFIRDADEIVHDEDLGERILGVLGLASS